MCGGGRSPYFDVGAPVLAADAVPRTTGPGENPMDSVQTLHDFALNLLNDPTALAAFGTDPQGALAAAGLGDVSAADVHEVIPLVLHFVPVATLPAVGALPVVGDLTSVGTDATGIQGAIDQLTALTAGLGLPALP